MDSPHKACDNENDAAWKRIFYSLCYNSKPPYPSPIVFMSPIVEKDRYSRKILVFY